MENFISGWGTTIHEKTWTEIKNLLTLDLFPLFLDSSWITTRTACCRVSVTSPSGWAISPRRLTIFSSIVSSPPASRRSSRPKVSPRSPRSFFYIQASCRIIYIFIYTSVLTCSLFHPFFQVLTKRLLSLSVRFFLPGGKKFQLSFKQKKERETKTR